MKQNLIDLSRQYAAAWKRQPLEMPGDRWRVGSAPDRGPALTALLPAGGVVSATPAASAAAKL